VPAGHHRIAAEVTAAAASQAELLQTPAQSAPAAARLESLPARTIMHGLEDDPGYCMTLTGEPSWGCIVASWAYIDADEAFSTMRQPRGAAGNTSEADAGSARGRRPDLSPFEQYVFFLAAFRSLRGGGRLAIASFMFGVTVPTGRRYYNLWAVALGQFYNWQQPPATTAQAAACCPSRTASNLKLPPGGNPLFLGDCTERWVDAPHDAALNSALFSAYKKHTTVKYLVISIGNSYVDYVSAGYCGGCTDNGLFMADDIALFLAGRE